MKFIISRINYELIRDFHPGVCFKIACNNVRFLAVENLSLLRQRINDRVRTTRNDGNVSM